MSWHTLKSSVVGILVEFFLFFLRLAVALKTLKPFGSEEDHELEVRFAHKIYTQYF